MLRVVRRPKEHWHGRSIDLLFRSAPLAHSRRVIAVLLTGSDDDGAAGLLFIKQYRGIAIVQTPPRHPLHSMPDAVLRILEPDMRWRSIGWARCGKAWSAATFDRAGDLVRYPCWSAVRVLEESAQVAQRVAEKTSIMREELIQKAQDRAEHARVIRQILLESSR